MANLNKKIAIYGGSFNPIHIGHLLIAQELVDKLKYDSIIFIPDNIPVHKNTSELVSSEDRLKMVKLAIKNNPNFYYSDIEIKRGDFSYTYDTILQLQKELKYSLKFGVVIGEDLLEGLDKWKNIDLLLEMADFICMRRKIPEKMNKISQNKKYLDKIMFFENRIFEVSSSEIRKNIKSNLSIDYLVTKEVKKYINKNKLYRK